MKIKVLKVRIEEAFLSTDQKIIDNFLSNKEIWKTHSSFVKDENYWSVIIYYEDLKSNTDYLNVNNSKFDTTSLNDKGATKYSAENEQLNNDENKILESLKLWRSKKAKDQNLPPYIFATNKELVSIAKYKPLKKEELIEIKGFGRYKVENFGDEIIDILEEI